MTNYKEIIYDISTGETSERLFSKKESDEILEKEKQADAYSKIKADQAIQRQAILDKLGLTADEARLLLG